MKRNVKKNITMLLLLAGMYAPHGAWAQPAASPWLAPSYADTLANPVPAGAEALKQGRKLYDKLCTGCHGFAGRGDGPASAAMQPKPADHTSRNVQQQSDGSLFYKIYHGRGMMTPFHTLLTTAQCWQLVHYIRSLDGDARTQQQQP